MRDNLNLEKELKGLLSSPFSDMEIPNKIEIKFGRKAKRRFGSIKMSRDKTVSFITINGIFKNEFIPLEIIQATIAHELCHYAHGFCSPLPQKYKMPHQGGVIKKEMAARGLIHLYNFEKKWSKENWAKVVSVQLPASPPRRHRRVKRRRESHQSLELKRLLRSAIRQWLA
ncbi:MAG: hypothetical protein ACI9QC_000762 [Oceanicoccus sp.]|jgi:hypothetical protein